MISIYTDGSSLNNGRKNSKGAFACVYPSISAESFGRPLPADGSQTNQTAELTGILEGVRTLKTISDVSGSVVRICTDSEYAINCLTKWITGWRKRDWKTAEGKPVVHKVLLEAILKELEEGLGGHQFVHVKAHTGGEDTDSKWNDYADQLATKAAELGRPVKFEELVKIMGAPISETDLVKAILANTASLDAKFLGTALISALKKTMNARAYDLEKTKIHGAVAYRLIEKTHLTIEKLEE